HDGSSWSTPATLDNSTDDVGWYSSLVIDSNDNLHVTYQDYTNGTLEYLTTAVTPPVISYSPSEFNLTNNTAMSPTAIPTNTGGAIPSGIIDSTVNLGYSETTTSLVLDSNGSKHISYIQYVNGGLKYATDKSGNWVNTTIDSTTGTTPRHCCSIALDSNENVHISYYNSSSRRLNYATNQNGSWETSELNSGSRAGKYSSIALDSNDNIHISYIHDGSVNYSLDYASNINGSWSFTNVVRQGSLTDTSLAIDSNDKVHISYGMQTGKLMYSTNKNGSWVSEIADWDSYVGAYSSLVLDSNDNAHISHHGGIGSSGSGSGLGQRLKYSTNAGGSWVNFNLDSYVGTSTYTGRYTSIALDSNENLHISYMDGVTKDLKYATNKSGGWVYTTLDAKGNTGLSTSLALDSSDNIHISYSLTQSPNPISGCELKYITLDSSSNVLGYSVSPALPAGLSLDIGTGEISGTPTAISPLTTYSVTALNTGGSFTTSVNITVNAEAPVFSYAPDSLVLTNNSAMATLSPTTSGGDVVTWSIDPALSSGLLFNTTNGEISGIPDALSVLTVYT
ncbi:MAG: Ig domain-containing protein, partial [Candidatus Poseidoniaceae archaeon]|nr:Ig domain-containing protein [Candidatus Poseidoniaceae archaeon]